jgi:hypothetical protein
MITETFVVLAISTLLGVAAVPPDEEVRRPRRLYISLSNPYGADDPRHRAWLRGHVHGRFGSAMAEPASPAYCRGWQAGRKVGNGFVGKRHGALLTIARAVSTVLAPSKATARSRWHGPGFAARRDVMNVGSRSLRPSNWRGPNRLQAAAPDRVDTVRRKSFPARWARSMTVKHPTWLAAIAVALMLASPAIAEQPGVRCVQDLMNALGFDAGAPDGLIGQKTIAATEAYRKWMSTSAGGPGWAQPSLNRSNGEFWCDRVADAHPRVASFKTGSGTPIVGSASTNAAAAATTCSPELGKWTWFRGGDVAFRADGRVFRQSHEANWTCKDNVVTIRWLTGAWIDTLALSRDRRRLRGVNNINFDVWGSWKSAE